MTVLELAEVGYVSGKDRGRTIRVRVCDSGRGYGPAVDVREFISSEAYPVSDTRPMRVKARKNASRGPVTRSEGYTGPTKAGFWLDPEKAVRLANLLYEAVEQAERLAREGYATPIHVAEPSQAPTAIRGTA